MAQAYVYQPVRSNHVEVTSSVIRIHIKMKVKKIVWTLITLGIVVVLLAVGTYLFNLFTAFDAEKAYFSGQIFCMQQRNSTSNTTNIDNVEKNSWEYYVEYNRNNLIIAFGDKYTFPYSTEATVCLKSYMFAVFPSVLECAPVDAKGKFASGPHKTRRFANYFINANYVCPSPIPEYKQCRFIEQQQFYKPIGWDYMVGYDFGFSGGSGGYDFYLKPWMNLTEEIKQHRAFCE